MYNDLRIQRRYALMQLPTDKLAEKLDLLCKRALDNLTDKNKSSLRSLFTHAASVTELIDYTWALSHRFSIPYEGQDPTLEKVSAALQKNTKDNDFIENIRNYVASVNAWREEATNRGLFTGNFLKRSFDAVKATQISKEMGVIRPKNP